MRVKVVTDGELAMPGVPLTVKPWRTDEEIADLRSFRVGIMPLPDDPWTRGKCGVKLLQTCPDPGGGTRPPATW